MADYVAGEATRLDQILGGADCLWILLILRGRLFIHIVLRSVGACQGAFKPGCVPVLAALRGQRVER